MCDRNCTQPRIYVCVCVMEDDAIDSVRFEMSKWDNEQIEWNNEISNWVRGRNDAIHCVVIVVVVFD